MAESDSSSSTASRPLLSRSLSRELQVLVDLLILTVAFLSAYLLRYDFSLPPGVFRSAMAQLPLVLILQFAFVFLTGIYSFVWRYIGMAEVQAFLRAAFYSAVPLFVLRLGLPDTYSQWRIPLSVIFLDTALAFGGLLTARVLRRALYERSQRSPRGDRREREMRRPVLLVGAGRAGVMTVREIQGRGGMDIDPVGFVDDDLQKQGTVIHGIKVLGTTKDIPALVQRLGIDHVIITVAEVDRQTMRRILDICDRVGIRAQIIPGLYEILEGRVSISRFRPLQIEDLLGRQQVRLDRDVVESLVTAKRIMVTGAGGSIGSELARQVAHLAPESLLLVERAEPALFEVDRELRRLWPDLNQVALVADVGDAGRMRSILDEHRPHVILHAAAHKHVPLMEENPLEAIKNNVLATNLLGTLAGELGVEAFVLISTDKAIRPTSVMGASKRVAELVIQDLNLRNSGCRYVAVRFGNVLGSTGSVIPIFREQIKNGGPVTVTHAEMRRYFMTVSEAAQLVLEAGAIGKGGEIMILEMGQPVKILDLAKDMIRLSGLEPLRDIPIVFTGLRPGEKLSEELELPNEQLDRTRHPKVCIGRLSPYPPAEMMSALERLTVLSSNGNVEEILAFLAELVPEANLQGDSRPDDLDDRATIDGTYSAIVH